MTDAPKLNAYIVALNFGENGPLYVNAMVAPNEAVAAAGIAVEFFQKEGGGTDKPLIGVSVGQLTPEFLRIALQAHERGLDPGKPNIVSLVPDPLIQNEPAAGVFGYRAPEQLQGADGVPMWRPDDPA